MTAEERLMNVHDQLVWLSRECLPEPALNEDDGTELYDLCRRVVSLAKKTGRTIHVNATKYYSSYDGSDNYGGNVTVFYADSTKEFGHDCVQEDIDNAHKAIREALELEEAATGESKKS